MDVRLPPSLRLIIYGMRWQLANYLVMLSRNSIEDFRNDNVERMRHFLGGISAHEVEVNLGMARPEYHP